LLSRKFSKFLKRNHNKDNNKDRYGNKKSNDFNSKCVQALKNPNPLKDDERLAVLGVVKLSF